MITDSSLFRHIAEKYLPAVSMKNVLAAASGYERFIDLGRPLTDINGENVVEVMDYSLNMVKKANKILSCLRQIYQNAVKMKISKKKLLELERIRITNLVSGLDVINQISTKKEKDDTKKFMIKEQLILLEEELEEISYDVNVADSFVQDADNLLKYTYSYYQAVKKIYDGSGYKGGFLGD